VGLEEVGVLVWGEQVVVGVTTVAEVVAEELVKMLVLMAVLVGPEPLVLLL
jgi:hypothetical protein